MRIFIAVIAIALLTVSAHGPAMAKGKKHQDDAPKADDQAKKKTDEAYKKALKTIPPSDEKPDPWKNIR